MFESFGKLLFCCTDLIVGYIVYHLLSKNKSLSATQCLIYTSISVLFNPITVNVSSRGNADMLVVLFVMLTLYALHQNQLKRAAIWYALSIHTKLYPVIYAPAIYLYLRNKDAQGWKRLINGKQVQFGLVAFVVLACSTSIFYYLYVVLEITSNSILAMGLNSCTRPTCTTSSEVTIGTTFLSTFIKFI